MPESTPSGRQLGDFRILRELGRGGMGVVYAAEHVKSGRRVALKVLEAHFTLQRSAIDRFLREGRAALSLRHPHIVRVEQVREHEGVHWFAMELVEGASLADLIGELQRRAPGTAAAAPARSHSASGAIAARAPADWLEADRFHRAAQLLSGIARALEHAHRRSILHRDVKPSNILLRPDGHALLIDFGLAREQGLPGLTHTGDLVGSPYYVAPEQIRAGHPPFDPRIDVYGLGVVLYELVTLRRPFEGETQHEVLDRIADGAAAPPRSVRADLPAALELICLRAMAHSPRDRYPSAAELARDLEQFAAGRAGRLHASPWQRFQFRGGERSIRHAQLAAAGALLVAGLAGGAWWLATIGSSVNADETAPELDAALAATRGATASASATIEIESSAGETTLAAWTAATPVAEPSVRVRLPLLEPLRVAAGATALRLSAPGHLSREFCGERAPDLPAGATWCRHVWLPPWEVILSVATPAPLVAREWIESGRELLLGLESGALLRARPTGGASPFAVLDGELRSLVALRGGSAAFAASVRTGGRARVVLLAGDGSPVGSLAVQASVTSLSALDVDDDRRDELLVGEDDGRLTLHRLDPSPAEPGAAPSRPLEIAVRGEPRTALQLGRRSRLLLLTSTELAELDLDTPAPAPVRCRSGIARGTELLEGPGGVPLLVDRGRGRILGLDDGGEPRFDHDCGGPIAALLRLPEHDSGPETLLLAGEDGRCERIDSEGRREAWPEARADGRWLDDRAIGLDLLHRADGPPWVVAATSRSVTARTPAGDEAFTLPLREPPIAFETTDSDGDGDDEFLLTFQRRVELFACPSRLLLRAGENVVQLRVMPTSTAAPAKGALVALQADGRALYVDARRGPRAIEATEAIRAIAFADPAADDARSARELWVAHGGRVERLDASSRATAGSDLALGNGVVLRLEALRGPAGPRLVVADSAGGIQLLTGDGHREQRATPRQGATLRGLAVGDVDGDGADEIAAAWAPTGVIVFDSALRPYRPFTAAGDVVDVAVLPADSSGRSAFAVATADGRLHRLDARGEPDGVIEVPAPLTTLAAAPPGSGDLALLGCASGELFALQDDRSLRDLGTLDQPVVALAVGVGSAAPIAALSASSLHVGTLHGSLRRLAAAAGSGGRVALLDFDEDGTLDVAWVGGDGRLHLRTLPPE
jgi:hypothetical protein